MPNVQTVAMKLLDRAKVFLQRAGTVIFSVAVVVWALAYFPRSPEIEAARAETRAAAETSLSGETLDKRLAEIDHEAAADHLAQSWLGRAGQVVEPVFAPLGWDWRVSAAVIAGFPAREVVVAVLGTIYAVGNDADDQSLGERLRARDLARRPAGLHAADGARPAAVLCLVLAVRRDARGDPARDEQLALANFRLELHDDPRLQRRVLALPARQRVMR